MEEILIGLGGNLPSKAGPPAKTIIAALKALALRDIEILKVSPLYQTSPMPASEQPDFINNAVLAQTALSAVSLLEVFKAVEQDMGRAPAERWSARTLDIDLLAYGSCVLPNTTAWHTVVSSPDPAATLPEPVVPHPRLHKRAFVLAPLMDIVPDWQHPILQKTTRALLSELEMQDQGTVQRLKGVE